MTAGTAYERRHTPQLSMARLWFGMLGGIITWAIAFFFSYPLAADCGQAGAVGTWLLTVAAVAVSAAATWVAWRNWQAVRDTSETGSGGWPGRAAFMSFSGILLSGAGLLLVSSHLIPLLFLEPCVAI